MATIEVQRAIDHLRSKKGKQTSDDQVKGNEAKMRALTNLCGKCVHVSALINNREQLILSCGKQHDPAGIYDGTKFNYEVECRDFSPIK